VDALAALKAQREGDRVCEIGRIGGRQLVGVGHAERLEHIGNDGEAI